MLFTLSAELKPTIPLSFSKCSNPIYFISLEKALKMIDAIAKDPEVGQIYEGKVTRLMNFGAFVDIGGGKEGLLHISKISNKRVEKVEDVLSVGDEIKVKVYEIDSQGRINLSMKDLETSNKEE